MCWAMNQNVKPAQKLLLIALAEWENSDQDVHADDATLAMFCQVPIERIPKLLAALEDKQLIHMRLSSTAQKTRIIRLTGTSP
ncbi:hypothetical protein UFOVP1670_52 [uncultured Caudovirales phage]|uniref:Uncharacterized protein n=1 Tax=uncultured Caudovirales phage TaxID=2100421 RepID=A0A6J5T731_9CAUD|nr:hypothetical protein UFOVP1670_52 [uncultured Caudovirales phage]